MFSTAIAGESPNPAASLASKQFNRRQSVELFAALDRGRTIAVL
jgi:hypothetical protein